MTDAVTRLITSTLTASLQQTVGNRKNLPVANNIVSVAIPIIANSIAKDTNKIVSKEANNTLNEIPKGIIGQNNPVNIVSSNQSVSSLQSTISSNLPPQVNSNVNNLVVNQIDELLRLNIPFGGNNPLFNSLKNNITSSLSKDVNNIINLALGNFSSGLFNKQIVTSPVVSNIDNIFTNNSPEVALEQYTEQYNSALVGEAFEESRRFDVNNAENIQKLDVTKNGFQDPTATYPKAEYKDKPDTNKLATGDVNGTIVQLKNQERMTGAKLPGDNSFSQPESPYKGEYPYNKVTQTESGHIIEIDDTPGAERIQIYHRTGTFVEIDSNGTIVKRTRGSDYEIIDRNGYISIAGKADISINGACNIYVGNDANIEVDGDTNITCHNDITAQAGGKFRLSAVEDFSIRSANVFIEADNELNLLSGTFTKSTSDIIYNKANTAIYSTTKDCYDKIENNKYEEIANDSHNKINGDYFVSTDGDMHIKVDGSLNMDTGGIIDLANGIAATAEDSKPAIRALNSYAGLLEGRKDVNIIELNDPSFLTLADTYVLDAEEPGATSSEVNKTKNKAVKAGITPKEKFESVPVQLDSNTPKTQNSSYVAPDENLKQISEAPDNFNLSPNFTLGMLSSKSAVTKNKLVAQAGRKYGELLFNLSAVALNICEPVRKLYPNMYVTSAFRLQAGSSATSQHPLGQAVDIQFKGISKKEYYDIAKVLATKLNYDQLLLEYASTTNNPWIHISIDPAKRNRTQVMTFNNHAKYADGLSQLA